MDDEQLPEATDFPQICVYVEQLSRQVAWPGGALHLKQEEVPLRQRK